MELLELIRTDKTNKSTIGSWFLGKEELNLVSLEDKDFGFSNTDSVGKILSEKVQNKSAIGVGEYTVTVYKSPRFSKQFKEDFYILLVNNVTGFNGILIHWGNVSEDTDGCLLVGKTKAKDKITDSRKGYSELIEKLAPIMGYKTKKNKDGITRIVPQEGMKSLSLKISRKYIV